MMEKSWRCIGDSTFVESTFAVDEEKKYFHAINAITDLVSSQALQSFQDGNVALVEKDRHLTACVTLPSLHSGHILGLSILTSVGEKFELLEELWKFKHGLSLLSDYYVNVHFSYGGLESKTWLPSAFVLRGPGLSPPPQTVRYSMAVNALNSFINTIGCLDFFNQGPLKVKQVSSLECPMMQPVWKAIGAACNENKNTTDECITSQNLHLTLESGYRNDIITTVKPPTVACNAGEGTILQQRTAKYLLCSSKDVGDKMISDTLNLNSSSKDKKAERKEASSKRTSDKQNKSKEGKSETSTKTKTKQHADSSDVNWKVIDFHASGKLQSLTVTDLKCFLAGKKMKVGGKKEELIQRVISLLGC